ncbi:MAG: Holliday junction branch migration protein RuvA [Candidatus Levybacteria bacterium]|nr:Holliday junction branch migration protein RuvA [Candidatus Levybacteria bacterium]
MIGTLHGTVTAKLLPSIIVEVNGVGYKVLVDSRSFERLTLQEDIRLYIHTYVREDALDLYGFKEAEDLRLFELLISVSGVGCKSALGVFSVGSRSQIVNAVVTGDVSFFTSVPRLGKKNGQKIIIELKNKLGGVEDLDLTDSQTSQEKDAISALESVGLTLREAEQAVSSTAKEGMSTEEIVRLALKQMGKKS